MWQTLAWLSVGLSAALVSCGSTSRDAATCRAESVTSCSCADGASGERICAADGSWGTCSCDSAGSAGAAGAPAGSAGASGSGGDGGHAGSPVPTDPCDAIVQAEGLECNMMGSQTIAAAAQWTAGCREYGDLVVEAFTLVLEMEPTGAPFTIIADTVTLNPGSELDADGYGYPADSGPGRGSENPFGSGAGHGGEGGPRGDVPGGLTYGSRELPITAGSGGGVAGGGAIRICARRSIIADGNISANGLDSGATGAGAGGSILLIAPTISGTGTLSARGGAISWPACGGAGSTGGGGRISLRASTNDFDGVINVEGGGAVCGWGAAGTGTSFFGTLP